MFLTELHETVSSMFDMSLPDVSLNGVQVENNTSLKTLGFAVDADIITIKKAIDKQVDVLVVHHGLFWGKLEPITEILYQKIKLLLENQVALYALHLPLDVHPALGNNVQIAQTLGLKEPKQWIHYRGAPLGYIGTINPQELHVQLKKFFSDTYQQQDQQILSHMDKKQITVGVSSGAFGSSLFIENHLKCELFLVGETDLPTYNLAIDHNKIIIPVGHYCSEVWGLKAMMKSLQQKYQDLNYKFIDNIKYI